MSTNDKKKKDPTSTDSRLGLHVKRLRTERKWSQEDLAEYSGLSKAYISKTERGVASPNLKSLEKLAAGFGMTLSDLFRFQNERVDTPELKAKVIKAAQETPDNASPELLYTKILSVFISR